MKKALIIGTGSIAKKHINNLYQLKYAIYIFSNSKNKVKLNNKDIKLNLYYTPTVLTVNSLVFDKKLMKKWWKSGFKYAKSKDEETMSEFRPDVLTDKEM